MKKQVLVGVLVVVVALGAFLLYRTANAPTPEGVGEETKQIVGGDRDEHGCLGPAGYAYDETIGACVRGFELTPDIAEAARLAVEQVGSGYALTVVSFHSYEEPGAYDILLERGEERTPETVYVRGGVVVPKPTDESGVDTLRMTLTMKEWEWVKTEYAGDSCTCPTGYAQSGEVCDPTCRNSTPPRMAPSVSCESLAGKEMVTPNEAGAFTLTFAGEGSVAIGTDCNSMSSTYEKIGSSGEKQKIAFGPIAATQMYCEGSQEQEFSSLLEKTTAYAFSGNGELLLYQGEESVTTLR